MSAIADRAGVGKPTIYLRWPNVAAVIAAALQELELDDETTDAFQAAAEAFARLRSTNHGPFLAEMLIVAESDRPATAAAGD